MNRASSARHICSPVISLCFSRFSVQTRRISSASVSPAPAGTTPAFVSEAVIEASQEAVARSIRSAQNSSITTTPPGASSSAARSAAAPTSVHVMQRAAEPDRVERALVEVVRAERGVDDGRLDARQRPARHGAGLLGGVERRHLVARPGQLQRDRAVAAADVEHAATSLGRAERERRSRLVEPQHEGRMPPERRTQVWPGTERGQIGREVGGDRTHALRTLPVARAPESRIRPMRTWAVLIALVVAGCGGGSAAAPTVTAPEPPVSTATSTGQAPATTAERAELTFPATTPSEVLALAGQRPTGVATYTVEVAGNDTTPGVSYSVELAADDSRARIHQIQEEGADLDRPRPQLQHRHVHVHRADRPDADLPRRRPRRRGRARGRAHLARARQRLRHERVRPDDRADRRACSSETTTRRACRSRAWPRTRAGGSA